MVKKFFLVLAIFCEQVMSKTIVIHLDVNGTIMAADPVQGKTSQDAMTQEFAKKTKGVWREDLTEMRYQDYVEQHLIPGTEVDQGIKKKRRELYTNFLTMLKETNHSALNDIQQKYDELLVILQTQQGPLYASFWQLLEWAQESEHDVRFVFRTFGQDIPELIHLLRDKGHHVSNIFGFEKGQLYHGHFEGLQFIKNELCEDTTEIFKYPFNAVQDDWFHWNSNGELETYAKPFHYHADIISFFFDDNAKVKQIIAPKGFQGIHGQDLTTYDLLQSGHVIAVGPLKAMTDPNYFVTRVKAVLENKG